ncbi:hypothetical protein M758_5G148000, partial [Ceratodon purpureus]
LTGSKQQTLDQGTASDSSCRFSKQNQISVAVSYYRLFEKSGRFTTVTCNISCKQMWCRIELILFFKMALEARQTAHIIMNYKLHKELQNVDNEFNGTN